MNGENLRIDLSTRTAHIIACINTVPPPQHVVDRNHRASSSSRHTTATSTVLSPSHSSMHRSRRPPAPTSSISSTTSTTSTTSHTSRQRASTSTITTNTVRTPSVKRPKHEPISPTRQEEQHYERTEVNGRSTPPLDVHEPKLQPLETQLSPSTPTQTPTSAQSTTTASVPPRDREHELKLALADEPIRCASCNDLTTFRQLAAHRATCRDPPMCPSCERMLWTEYPNLCVHPCGHVLCSNCYGLQVCPVCHATGNAIELIFP